MADRQGFFGTNDVNWANVGIVDSAQWKCGYCGNQVASISGYSTGSRSAFIRMCPGCAAPTFFDRMGQAYPSGLVGESVNNVPGDLTRLYDEARLSVAAGAHTAAVLVCRKMLAHIAVDKGDSEDKGKPFVQYVEYLANRGYVPPDGHVWVDYVRRRANQATHEIVIMTQADAEALIKFVAMLLRFIYELPGLVPAAPG